MTQGYFSSGPTRKHPAHSTNKNKYILGRSHISSDGRKLTRRAMDLTRQALQIPDEYQIIFTPGSTTGAIEISIWNLLGINKVDALVYDVFGERWANDISSLGIPLTEIRVSSLEPSMEQLDLDNNDIVFVLNSTVSGTKVNTDMISNNRNGIVICDAACAAFCDHISWHKLDAIGFAPQKGLGGEAGFGILVLSPRAISRLMEYTPNRAIPKLFNLRDENNQFRTNLMDGYTINTISMMSVIDYLDGLEWFISKGGHNFGIRETQLNANIIESFINNSTCLEYIVPNKEYRTMTPALIRPSTNVPLQYYIKQLNDIQIYDILHHPKGPSGFRIWCGLTIPSKDIEYLLTNLENIISCIN